MDYDYKNHLILVFDDFHTIEENNVFELMKAIVRERLTGLQDVYKRQAFLQCRGSRPMADKDILFNRLKLLLMISRPSGNGFHIVPHMGDP